MHKKVLTTALISILSLGLLNGVGFAAEAAKVAKYEVSVDQKYFVPYPGATKGFANGFLKGFGSGLALKAVNADGSIEFYGITDRGPNGDGPDYIKGSTELSSKFFPAPAFQPQIAVIKIQGGVAEVVSTIGLKNKENEKLTGLPISPGEVGSTNEIALSETYKDLGYDDNGLDTEGIALDAKGNFWTCDEYGPFISQFNSKGTLLRKYAPGNGLPAVLSNRIPNRGFEGLTIAPNGKVFAVVQSVLNIANKTGKTAQFTRIVELDPATGETKMYAYPIDVAAYKAPKDAKIGDIYAISNTKMLIIEQGKDKNKTMRNLIYLVDLAEATDLSETEINGKEPEFASADDLSAVKFASKQLVFDLKAAGWEAEKAEGITMLPDKKTIVVTNDNDFGMAMKVTDSENKKTDPTSYTLSENGSFTYKGKKASPDITVVPTTDVQQIWLIELTKPLE